jgi:hypothetical protein
MGGKINNTPTGFSNGVGSDAQKYRFVEEILTAPDYYKVLDVTKKATTEDIRRAYIKVTFTCIKWKKRKRKRRRRSRRRRRKGWVR